MKIIASFESWCVFWIILATMEKNLKIFALKSGALLFKKICKYKDNIFTFSKKLIYFLSFSYFSTEKDQAHDTYNVQG